FLSCGCVLQNRTLFSGISLLPSGSVWTFQQNKPVTKQKYFETGVWGQQEPLGASEFYERFRTTWERIVPRYLRGDARIALSLTGGLDSRMILAWLPGKVAQLPCYTFASMYRDCADVTISRRIAEICHQEHRT